jgi:hypothetical protein
MEKEFIPYEQALALRELGFESPYPIGGYQGGKVFYYEKGELYYDGRPMYSSDAHSGQLLAPLYQQAFRWFREKKLSDSCICRYQGRDDGGIYYYYCINNDFGVEETRYFKEGFYTYEEAELECLKKLIEIVKTK